ncbi:MAG: HD-GYP domain-containing protein, partial [Pseudomonadales bacterium]
QAAVALDNALLLEAQDNLLDSFIALIARAIDAKSPYTGGHCERVPVLAKMLAGAACEADAGPFADFKLTREEWRELHLAAWLHDCGKVTTPDYVVDKATKLETITDRIHEIRMRFEVIKREKTITCLQQLLAGEGEPEELQAELDKALAQLDDDFHFIAGCNLGGESMAAGQEERIKRIAAMTWTRTLDDRAGVSQAELKRRAKQAPKTLPCTEPLLADRPDHIIEHNLPVHSADPDNPYGFKVEVPRHKYNLGEVHNLCIAKGTLTPEERFKINDHIVQTIVMLKSLPLPRHLQQVPDIAGGHHERMDGTGYPRRLKGEQLPMQTRMLALADVFEALTAADRPYKPAKTLDESIQIIWRMVQDGHLDGEVFRLFLESGVYRDYAAKYMQPTQRGEINIADWLG